MDHLELCKTLLSQMYTLMAHIKVATSEPNITLSKEFSAGMLVNVRG